MNVKGKADLHFHTECSGDSYMPLYAVIPAAERLGLSAIAKTDHDSVSGCRFLAEQAKNSVVEFIPGVELSTAEGLHVLGYFVDPEHKALADQCEGEKAYGRTLLHARISAWRSRGGCLPEDIDALIERVRALRPEGEISMKQVYDHLTGLGMYLNYADAKEDADEQLQGFVPPSHTPPPAEQVVAVVMEAGGVAVIAHPPPSRLDDVERLLEAGAVGVGALNVKAVRAEARPFWQTYAEDHGIILTGGTDWHGPVEKWNIERMTITPYDAVLQLKAAVKRIHGRKV
jgi:predicted metal-dependent phosphoesterase TrpH